VTGAAHGDARAAYDAVEALYLPLGIAIFVVVAGAVLVAALQGRARARRGVGPGPTREHRARELAVAGAIAAIGAVLLVVTFRHEDARTEAKASVRPTLRVDVTSFRWGWRFTYPDLGGVATRSPALGVPAILRVPAGATVRFTVIATDVIHSFWLPELRFKRDVFPQRRETFDLAFPRQEAMLGGHCAEFCGLGHADMNFAVDVLPRRAFDAWIAEHRRRAR
jgi:cytochrome c oxidase subunit 2